MSKVYAIVSQETPFFQHRVWGVASSLGNAEIVCDTVRANNRAYGTIQVIPFEVDELCPAEEVVWRVMITKNGGGSHAVQVKREEGRWSIVQLDCGSFLAFVDTEYKEDAVSEAYRRRLIHKQELRIDPDTYDKAMARSAEINRQAHEECNAPKDM